MDGDRSLMRGSRWLLCSFALVAAVSFGEREAFSQETPATSQGEGVFGVSCAQGYAKAFADLNTAASAMRLKGETAEAEVAKIFRKAPLRCEFGGYEYYLTQLLSFVKRAARSGTSPETPKEGFMKAAAAASGFPPARVPRAEYYDDMQRFQAARKEVLALCTEAGMGPLYVALLAAFDKAVPAPGDYGPRTLPAQPTAQQPPPAQPTAQQPPGQPPGQQAPSTLPQRITVPTVPLPDWAVIRLHQGLELLRQQREQEARQKIDDVLRWIESQR